MSKAAKGAIVAIVAVLAFGGAFLLFGGGDDNGSDDDMALDMDMDMGSMGTGGAAAGKCPTDTVTDNSYSVSFPSAPKVDATSFKVNVTRNGNPVAGATVCIGADMTGMSHAPMVAEAKHLSGGQYEFTGKFAMRGRWDGSVTVAEPGKKAVRVPVSFDVA